MRIIFFADLHVAEYREFHGRLDRCLDALQQILDYAGERRISVIVDAGDLFEQKNFIDFKAYNGVYRILDQFYYDYQMKHGTAPQFISLVGNHNIVSRGDATDNNLIPLQNLIHVVDEPYIHAFGEDVYLTMFPYTSSVEKWNEWIGRIEKARRDGVPHVGKDILVGHQELVGAKTGTHRYTVKPGRGLTPSAFEHLFDWCVFGHYHLQQWLSQRTMYLGAALQQEFGEEGNPQGFWVYDSDKPRHEQWQWVMIESPFFATVTDPALCTGNNYYRLRTAEKIDRANVDAGHVRVEPVKAETETGARLASAPSSWNDLINKYLSARYSDPQRLETVRQAIQELRL